MAESASESRCPLCEGPNECVRAGAGEAACADSCWCAGRRFPAELLARLPAAERGRRCICERCLDRHAAPASEPR